MTIRKCIRSPLDHIFKDNEIIHQLSVQHQVPFGPVGQGQIVGWGGGGKQVCDGAS